MFEEKECELKEELDYGTRDTWSFELFNQIADRFRTLLVHRQCYADKRLAPSLLTLCLSIFVVARDNK